MKIRSWFTLAFLLSLLVLVAEAGASDPYKVLGVEKNARFRKLSTNEEKRKSYDMNGFDAGHPGDGGGYTYSTSGGPRQSEFKSGPGGSQHMGGQGSSWTFSFPFGGSGGWRLFGFNIGDVFSNLFGGFSGSSRSQSQSKSAPKRIRGINSKGKQNYESIIEEVASILQGAIKVGSINCETEYSLCKDLGLHPGRAPRLFVYSYKGNEKGSLKEYKGDLVTKNAKSFCQDHLPRFSERISLNHFDLSSNNVERYPRLMLLSTKKDTPVIWRVLSGFCEEVRCPAVIGWMSNGEKHILKSGISVTDLKPAIKDLGSMLHGFEKKNKKVASSKQTDSAERRCIPIIPSSVLFKVSQKSLSRRQNVASGSKDSVSYTLLDASTQPSFLSAFHKSGYKSSDKILVAFKPRKGKFAAFKGDMTVEKVEGFVSSVLNGDVQFCRTRQKPVPK
ncbi:THERMOSENSITIVE MALE STERILE 1 [Hibiscus trionum]|uniref:THERMOSENSITIVE MALE STERILE 1 n=1 Tax=Hibiscus trionum TaxID=183268 RepID=A0A9W7IXU6_HIBTR|nr:THERMOSENSITIVE MALE STERILE 1 [Hibiscus trionum]